MWFLVSLGFWALVAFAVARFLQYGVFLSGGVLRLTVRINERLLMDRFNVYLASKPMLTEERLYDDHNTVVHYSWEERSRASEFGHSAPRVTVAYDRATGYMLSVSVEYNKRMARRNQGLTGAEVRNKVCDDMVKAAIFEDATYSFKEDVILAGAEDLRAFADTKRE